jgi:hypothetical protein
MPSKSRKLRPPAPHSSRRKPGSKPKLKLSPTPAPYLVIDTTLPSNIFSERSLFVTYSPQNKIYRTAFGNEIVIEGTGEVHVHIFASGQPIFLRMTNCWHVPSSPHHFISTLSGCLRGNQFMIASRTPRMLFSHKYRLSEPNSPKYVPLTREDGFLVLRFKLPAPIASVSQVNPLSLVQVPSSIPPQPVSITTRTPAVALSTTIDQPFACLLVQRQLPFSPPDSPLISPHHSPSSPFHIPQAYSVPRPPTPPLIPVSISQPFSSLNYTLFDSQPSFDSPNFYNSTFNPPSEASISIPSYPIPTFNPQSIQQPQRPSLSEPLPVLHNFTVPSFNPPSETPFPIISYPVPTFNPQSIQQPPHTPPLFAHKFEAIHPMLHPHSQARCQTHSPPLGSVQPRLLPFPSDSRDTLISRSLPLHPPISSSTPFSPFLNTLLVQRRFGPRPIPPRLKMP